MERRGLLKLACAIMPITALDVRAEAARAEAVQRTAVAPPDQAKVVYHLSDLDKVDFVLGNIRNHYNGMGGPDKVTIALVVHGPALKAFHTATAAPEVTQRTADAEKSGLAMQACIHTMRSQEVTIKDLLPGFGIADRGGVVRIAELQSQGYVYLRP
jgi:intracellular sulfur oxidation DsrE/DsrF family protein